MRKTRKIYHLVQLTGLLLFFSFVSCEPENKDCTATVNDIYADAGFYTIKNNIDKDTILSDLVIYGTYRPDTLIIDLADVKKIQLPLVKNNDTSRFVVVYNSMYDTLTIVSDRKMLLEETECGFDVSHTLKKIKSAHVFIDSAAIIIPEVDNNDKENIKIFIF